MRISRRVLCLLPRPLIASLSAFVWMVPTSASAQPNQPNQPNNAAGSGATGTSPAPPPAPASPATTAGSNGAAPAPAATAAPVMMVPPYGFPPAGTRLEGNLPSSSRATSDTSRSADGFDLNGASSGGGTVHGGANAPMFQSSSAALSGRGRVPTVHVVRRGDTLWDVCDHYYGNPWQWPKVWSLNTNVANPHWIYPGDHVRLWRGEDPNGALTGRGGDARKGFFRSDAGAMVRLRDEGFVDDETRDVIGVVSGSPDDRMLLDNRNIVYLEMTRDHRTSVGAELTLLRSLRRGPAGTKGMVIQILGTVRVDAYDEKKKMARATILESLDVIERGVRVGIVPRRFDVPARKKNEQNLRAAVLAAVQPLIFQGRDQVVFLDKGSADGLAAGNHLTVSRRGDPWRATIRGAGDLSDKTIRTTVESTVEIESVRGTERDADYPEEAIGDLLVLHVRERSATALVTMSRRELVQGDTAVAKKGD